MSKPCLESLSVEKADLGGIVRIVDTYPDHLVALGYRRRTIVSYVQAARHFAKWTGLVGVPLNAINATTIDRFRKHRCQCHWASDRPKSHFAKNYIGAVRNFVDFLTKLGLVPTAVKETKPVDPLIAEFLDWLRRHRGVSEQTAELRRRMLAKLLPALGGAPESYAAGRIRQVILDQALQRSRGSLKNMAGALRGYLRFLVAGGRCSPGLDHAVPTFPEWQLSTLPRYLPAPEVERLISSCDVTNACGIRDRAVLLFLARLGLRAGDTVALRLDDIAWNEGTIRLAGKSRRQTRLPLPQDVGDALHEYISRARPPVNSDRVFLRVRAPHQPLGGSSSISHIVDAALKRAGITTAPSRGAHVLRHSAATSMLRAGGTLDSISFMLRHRSANTTAQYAKVDINMLRQLSRPWPGELPC